LLEVGPTRQERRNSRRQPGAGAMWQPVGMTTLWLTGDDAADRLLSTDPLALLIGMLLDQQVPMETAFAGPAKLAERLEEFSAEAIAATDPAAFAAICATPPAVHRFPGSMATRIQTLSSNSSSATTATPQHCGSRETRTDARSSSGSRRYRDSGTRRHGSSSHCWASSAA